MSDMLPEAVLQGLQEARKAAQRRSNRLCVHVGEEVYGIHLLCDDGVAMNAEDAPKIRGHVQIYDGARHLYQALVVTSREEEGERVFEFKWSQPAASGPAPDYVIAKDSPAGFLTHRAD